MDHTELCDVARPLGAVWCHHDIPTRPSQLDQGPKRAGASPRTRSPNRFVAEPGDDSGDDFPIAMPADQHMGTGSSIADRDHQLLSMPKRENDVPPFSIQPINRFMAASLITHRVRDAANGSGSDRRQERTLHPLCDAFLQAVPTISTRHSAPHIVRHWSHPEIAWHAGGDRRLPVEAVRHESPFQQ